jgi:ribosomal protein L11 methyltransferase
MLALFPEGFEEGDRGGHLELAAYTTEAGEERARGEFGEVTSKEVESDWDERWKAFHRGAHVAGLWVGPPWQDAPADAPAVVIDPGRAFGTGSHPTTRLCIEHLADLPRGALLDLGCGSGVLSIAAFKLGFSPIVALDVEEAAVEAARRNCSANGVSVDVQRADVLDDPLPPVATAVANINARRVAALAPRVRCQMLVTSGYFEPHVPELDGYRRVGRRTHGGWAADLYTPQ